MRTTWEAAGAEPSAQSRSAAGNEPFPKIVITTCRECLAGSDYAVETRQPGPKLDNLRSRGYNGRPSFC